MPTFSTSFDGTTLALSVVATFRDNASPTSALVAVTGVTVDDFTRTMTGATRAGSMTVRPLGTSTGGGHSSYVVMHCCQRLVVRVADG